MKKAFTVLSTILYTCCTITLSSCLGDGEDTFVLENEKDLSGIPDDSKNAPLPEMPSIPTINSIPNPVAFPEALNGNKTIYRIDMTGLINKDGEWLRLYGPAGKNKQNAWIEIDNILKGFTVVNLADEEGSTKNRNVDLVFLVDNSGSMDKEANVIADDIINWAQKLERSGLDIKFGCVGYDEDGYINGGIDITSVRELSNFLERGYGTSRTKGFDGPNAIKLDSYADNYGHTGGENGVMALRFANDYYTFRRNSNRVYVNFTDEGNQPYGNSNFSVNWVKDNWTPAQGTVHTVFSDYDYNYEDPCLLSEYTGGTVIKTSSDFRNVNLDTLPVTGSLQNSYTFRFNAPKELMDNRYHRLTLYVYDKSKNAYGSKSFNLMFIPLQQ